MKICLNVYLLHRLTYNYNAKNCILTMSTLVKPAKNAFSHVELDK